MRQSSTEYGLPPASSHKRLTLFQTCTFTPVHARLSAEHMLKRQCLACYVSQAKDSLCGELLMLRFRLTAT